MRRIFLNADGYYCRPSYVGYRADRRGATAKIRGWRTHQLDERILVEPRHGKCLLTRTTAVLAVGFFATSLALSWLASFQRHPTSIINTGGSPGQEAPAGTTPLAPLDQGSGGVLNQLQKGIPGLPAQRAPAPAPAPSGPQVPQST